MALQIRATRTVEKAVVNASVTAPRAQSTGLAIAPVAAQFIGCLNKSSGVGNRNGTATHTIGGASPSTGCALWFTPTTGSLLVVIVAGSVTHTSSGAGAGSGWTERQSPVNSAELSLFTKTAVGNDFITLTHNGSNYPIAWVIYEFLAGSTYTSSSSETAADDTFPALGSLPGTAQFIIAAYCRSISTTGATAASATVSAPFVEDFDSFTTFATTSGIYLYVFYQEDFTGTTITPVITPTFTGSGVTADRQKVVAAFALV